MATNMETTLTTADKQKFMMEQLREHELILYRDTYLGDKVFEMARSGKSTDEILVWIWDNDYGKKYGLMPQAINNYLSKRGMNIEVRKALRAVPLLEKVDKAMMSRIEAGSDKLIEFAKKNLDPDFKAKDNTTNVTNIGKQITQINIQVVAPEEESVEEVYEVTPEL